MEVLCISVCEDLLGYDAVQFGTYKRFGEICFLFVQVGVSHRMLAGSSPDYMTSVCHSRGMHFVEVRGHENYRYRTIIFSNYLYPIRDASIL
jgi:hypothetical protein